MIKFIVNEKIYLYIYVYLKVFNTFINFWRELKKRRIKICYFLFYLYLYILLNFLKKIEIINEIQRQFKLALYVKKRKSLKITFLLIIRNTRTRAFNYYDQNTNVFTRILMHRHNCETYILFKKIPQNEYV